MTDDEQAADIHFYENEAKYTNQNIINNHPNRMNPSYFMAEVPLPYDPCPVTAYV